MSSATPIASSVRDVLLNTSAPIGRIDRTASRAASPESTTKLVIPLCSNAEAAAVDLLVGCQSRELGDRGFGRPAVRRLPSSLGTQFRQAAVHQRDGHRSLADCGRTTLDRSAAHVAGREESRAVRLERQR